MQTHMHLEEITWSRVEISQCVTTHRDKHEKDCSDGINYLQPTLFKDVVKVMVQEGRGVLSYVRYVRRTVETLDTLKDQDFLLITRFFCPDWRFHHFGGTPNNLSSNSLHVVL